MVGNDSQPFEWRKLYPWLIWFLSSSFIFYKYSLEVSPSIMVPDLMQAFSLDGRALGNLSAFYFYAYLLMQLPVGILLDRFKPRRILTTGILVCAFGAFVFAHAMYLFTAEIGRILMGLGGAFAAVGTMKLISIWFKPKQFALVSGLMMTMGMLGAVVGQAPLAYLTTHYGWRVTMINCSLAGGILALLIGLVIRDKAKTSTRNKKLSLQEFIAGILKIISNKQSWLVSIYSGLAFAPISAFAGLWGIPFMMQKYAMTRGLTASLVSLVFIGFALGSPLAGWLSDRIDRRKPIMIVGTSFSLITLSSIIYFPALSLPLLAFAFTVFGFFSGFFFVSFALMREIHSTRLSGTSIGFINMFNALCGALLEPTIGKLLDYGWDHTFVSGARVFSVHDYQQALSILPVTLVIALLLQIFIKESYCQSVN